MKQKKPDQPKFKFFKDIQTVAEKELKILAYAKLQMIFQLSIFPIVNLIVTFIIYGGFFASGSAGIGSVTAQNFASFLLLGNLAAVIWNATFQAYQLIIMDEKYWGTLTGILIAPISRYAYLFGVLISVLIKTLPVSIILIIVTYIYSPAFILNIIIAVLFIYLAAIGCAGFGIVWAVVAMANENGQPIMNFLAYIWIFFTCIQYPIDIFPPAIQFIVNLNPLYHCISLIRASWINFNIFEPALIGSTSISIIFVSIFSIGLVAVGIYLFNKIRNHP